MQALRLSVLLAQLGAEARAVVPARRSEADVRESTSTGRPPGRRRRRHSKPGVPSNITLGEIVERTEHAGFGFLIAFLALVSVPFVMLSTPFGLAIALVAAQMVAGRSRPWLPRRMRQHVVTVGTLEWLGQRVTRWTRGMERWIRPRWTVLARGPFWVLIGVGVTLQGLGLALPLPIPGSNAIFAVVIALYGIGLLEDDGLLILLAHIITGIEVILGVIFSEVVASALVHAYHRFSGWWS
ncbi:MAG TPA: exopolysaccharide biosynthesis protein [Phycisphaerae bacterium]|jgi:hypothetical protein